MNHARQNGFTLIEVLLAVAIFAVVLAAINTVFYSALRLRNTMNESLERSLPVEQALAIIKRDLVAIVPPGTLAGPLKCESASSLSITGQPTGPQIYTSTGTVNQTSPWGEVQKVTYYLRPPTNFTTRAGQDLFRAVTRNLLPSAEEQPMERFLLSDVEEIHFLFYTGTEWRESWDSSTEEMPLPKAIKVQLLMAGEVEQDTRARAPVELLVPIIIEASTNTTTNAGGQL